MLAAVQFDYEFDFARNEIDDIWSNRLLPAEFQFVKTPAPQGKPQFPFDVGLFATKLPGECVFHGPLTRLAALATLSHKGRGEGESGVSGVTPRMR